MPKILDTINDIDESSTHPDDGGKLSPGAGRESFKIAQFWKSQINAYDQAMKRWHKRASTVVKRFRDERNRIDEEGQRRMNLLWSNFKVMKPAIYSQCPIPIVDRTFLDKDPIARLSSQILERTLINQLKPSGFHKAINRSVRDKLLSGRGTVWHRYVPKIGEGASLPGPAVGGIEDPLYDIGQQTGDQSLIGETEKEEKLEETQSTVIEEGVELDYTDWADFYYFPIKARTWEEVQAVGKRVHISKKEARERFGDKIGRAMKPDTEPKIMGNTERQTYSDTSIFEDINERAITVFEIWNKSDERVYWVSTGYDYLCDVKDDPLELTGFFPCTAPLFATITNDTLVPVPDYIEWQDQAIQIDELTQRIAMLTKACKIAGVYNATHPAINRIFNESIENELIPVDQWAMFAEAGGLKGVIDFIPIDQIQACLETLLKVRQQAMLDLDQITGLSDVIRGTTDSRETLGGIRLKNNNAGTRLSEEQEDVAEYARANLVIMAEIICKHFSDEAIIEASGILYEDALLPDTLLREQQVLIDQQSPQTQGSPQQGQQPPQPQQAPTPQAPPMPQGPSPGAPAQGMPMQPQMPPQPHPGGNVVPFPGAGQPPQPGQGMPPMPPMPPPPSPDPKVLAMIKVGKAIELLRQDVTRSYRIDIETDSTIFGDKMQDQENATNFLTAVSGYMKQAELAAQMPETLPVFAKALQWGVRKFRVGRDLEAEIDNFADAMSKKAKQLIANPPPDPEAQKHQAEIQKVQLQAKAQEDNDQRDAARQQAEDQRQQQMDAMTHQQEQQKMQMEMQLEQKRMEMEMEKMQMEMQLMREKHQMELQKLGVQMQAKHEEHALKAQGQQMELAHQERSQQMDMAHEQQTHHLDMQHQQREHTLAEKELQSKERHMKVQHQHKMTEQKHAHKQKMKPKKSA